MIILDENVPESQWQLLRSWRIRALLIGRDLSEKGIKDDRLTKFLREQNRPTFFTRDEGFYDRRLCHAGYCLVYLAVRPNESALFVRRLLRSPHFKVRAKRLGSVIRVSSAELQLWRLREAREITLPWIG
ncbi:MAG TPA: hypothetical protein VGS22_23525 [Thermoanaerobaculia bacterium]|nr:hypothetical protein [Thermoanaerobaculia bacterium]